MFIFLYIYSNPLQRYRTSIVLWFVLLVVLVLPSRVPMVAGNCEQSQSCLLFFPIRFHICSTNSCLWTNQIPSVPVLVARQPAVVPILPCRTVSIAFFWHVINWWGLRAGLRECVHHHRRGVWVVPQTNDPIHLIWNALRWNPNILKSLL